MPATTRYRIAPLDVHAHQFLVRCTIDDPAPGGHRFTLPAWIPGSYLVREFARHFVAVRAEANGSAVPIVKETKDSWRAAPSAGPLTAASPRPGRANRPPAPGGLKITRKRASSSTSPGAPTKPCRPTRRRCKPIRDMPLPTGTRRSYCWKASVTGKQLTPSTPTWNLAIPG